MEQGDTSSRYGESLINNLHPDIIDEIMVWRLVLDKMLTYSELEELNFIDAIKLNALLDYKNNLKLEAQQNLDKNNGNQP